MKTLVVCLENWRVRILRSDDFSLNGIEPAGMATIGEAREALEALDREAPWGIILYGQPQTVSRFCQALSDSVRGRILAIIPDDDPVNRPLRSLCRRSRDAVAGKNLQARPAA